MNVLIIQAGLGPIGRLGFGPSGEPASLAHAPALSTVEPTDQLCIVRNGQLYTLTADALNTLAAPLQPPPQSAGVPAGGIWISEPDGAVEQAPVANLTYQTDANTLLVCLACGLFGGR
jgi:hypothetical protein